jgi:hypothetical protein
LNVTLTNSLECYCQNHLKLPEVLDEHPFYSSDARALRRDEPYRGANNGLTERKLKSMERKALNGLRN